MMRIAVAGGAGLGYLIAEGLANAHNAYNVVVLSRFARTYDNPDIQVIQVDYSSLEDLCFALQGVDLVISTVTGTTQLALISAAGQSRVRFFVPAEFEGKTDRRPTSNDPLDQGSSRARERLRQWQGSGMKYTIFSCGIFMERFHPSGLSSLGVGSSSGVVNVGDYILDLSTASAVVVERNAQNRSVRIRLTSIYDVAAFVVAAVDLGPENWPREFTMSGDHLSLLDLVGTCSRELGVSITQQRHAAADIPTWIRHYARQGDTTSVAYYQRLHATTTGRYDFGTPTLNALVNIQPTTFAGWLRNLYQL